MKGSIHIGTSGWSYKHWRTVFYPADVKAAGYLPFYAKQFATTEINTSFYHLPKPETVAHWIDATPGGFRFCPKISRYITHIKRLRDPGETLPAFFEIFDPVKKRLGPVLIQLPPSLVFHPGQAADFFKGLKQYKGFRFALEARHESWLATASITLLKKNRITWVMAESGGRWPYAEHITARNIYIRLHGPSGYDSGYPDDFLSHLAGKIKKWSGDGHTIWVFFNNDGHAFAIENARRMSQLTATNSSKHGR